MVFDFIILHHGIVRRYGLSSCVSSSACLFHCEIFHIFQIDPRTCSGMPQALPCGVSITCHFIGVERYGNREYIRLLYLAVNGTFQQVFPPSGIHQQEFGVIFSVQLPEHTVKTVIPPDQFFPVVPAVPFPFRLPYCRDCGRLHGAGYSRRPGIVG